MPQPSPVRQRLLSVLVFVPYVLFVAAGVVVGARTGSWSQGFIWAAMLYLIYSIVIRLIIPRDHNRGLRHMRRKEYRHAIRAFEASYAFYTRHAWLDQSAALALLGPSAGFREMALISIAMCYSSLKQEKRSRAVLQQLVTEFPNSRMARSARSILAARPADPADTKPVGGDDEEERDG